MILKANLYDVTVDWTDDEDGEVQYIIGAILNPESERTEEFWDRLWESNTDRRVFYWFDNQEEIDALVPGDEVSEDVCKLVYIDRTPEYVEERI